MEIEPVTREERFLAAAGGQSVTPPTPITRKEQLLQGIIDAVKSGGATPDVIENAVNNYLDANPVKPGATTEQAAQIEQNKTDIADLQEEIENKQPKGDYVKTVNGNKPDENGNVVVATGGNGSGENVGGISDTARELIIEIFNNITVYDTDQTANIAALNVALGGAPGESEPEEPEEPGGAVYTLATPYTTTGDSVLDTGVALADVDRDWSICCNLSGKPGYQIPAWGLGAHLGVWSTAAYKWYAGYNTTNWLAPTTSEIATGNLSNARIVVTHVKGEATITVHYVSAGAAASLTASGLDYSDIVGSTATVTLGGAPKTDGNAYWAANNTINAFEIYERVLTEAEVTAWLGVS